MLEAITYTLATVGVSAVLISYGIAYNLKTTQPILALLLFFFVVWISSLIITVKLWLEFMGLDTHLAGISVRGILLLLASLYLTKTTWRQNKN